MERKTTIAKNEMKRKQQKKKKSKKYGKKGQMEAKQMGINKSLLFSFVFCAVLFGLTFLANE